MVLPLILIVVALIGLAPDRARRYHTATMTATGLTASRTADLARPPRWNPYGTVPQAAASPASPSTTAARRPAVATRTRTADAATSTGPSSGCAAALLWLASHAAPGFRFECPGNALGHQAMTCVNVAGICPGQKIIAIADPCPAAYMNEAHNSWVLVGLAPGRLDPYGYCG